MGKLYVVATPIGNLTDISQRAVDTLSSVGFIAAEDTRRTLKLLNHFDIKTPIISNHKFNELARGAFIADKIINENVDAALVSDAGTPCIADPGSAAVRFCRERGIEVTAVPGASAVITALSVSGFYFDRFSFLGFIPKDKKDRRKYFELIANSPISTFVLFESPKRIEVTLGELCKTIPGCEAFVINDITKYYEKSYWGTVTDVLEMLSKNAGSELGEYTVVLQKPKTAAKSENPDENEETPKEISTEALLVDEIVKHGGTLKDASERVRSKNLNLGKNAVYKASLNLKKLFEIL